MNQTNKFCDESSLSSINVHDLSARILSRINSKDTNCDRNNESVNTNQSFSFNLSFINDEINQFKKIRSQEEERLTEKAIRNFFSILISISRLSIVDSTDKDAIEQQNKFLSVIQVMLLNKDLCRISSKYFSQDWYEKGFKMLRENPRISRTKKDQSQISKTITLMENFRLNLYKAITLDADDLKEVSKDEFDSRVEWFYQKYLDHIVLINQIDDQRKKNFQAIETICRLHNQIFNRAFFSNVKLLLMEQHVKLDLLSKKLELQQKEKSNSNSNHIDQNEDFYQSYRRLVIENHQLEKKISELQQRKKIQDGLDQSKVEKLKRLIDEIKFMQHLSGKGTFDFNENPLHELQSDCKATIGSSEYGSSTAKSTLSNDSSSISPISPTINNIHYENFDQKKLAYQTPSPKTHLFQMDNENSPSEISLSSDCLKINFTPSPQ